MGEVSFDWPSSLSDSDRVGLLQLYDEVARNEGTLGFYGPLTGEQGKTLVDSYAGALAAGGIHILLVRDEIGIVGTLTLEQPALHARRHIIDLKRCVIARRSRGQFMIEGWTRAQARAHELGGEVLTLEVRGDGPVELWRSIGFKQYGYLEDYARRDGTSIPGFYLYFPLHKDDKRVANA